MKTSVILSHVIAYLEGHLHGNGTYRAACASDLADDCEKDRAAFQNAVHIIKQQLEWAEVNEHIQADEERT